MLEAIAIPWILYGITRFPADEDAEESSSSENDDQPNTVNGPVCSISRPDSFGK